MDGEKWFFGYNINGGWVGYRVFDHHKKLLLVKSFMCLYMIFGIRFLHKALYFALQGYFLFFNMKKILQACYGISD